MTPLWLTAVLALAQPATRPALPGVNAARFADGSPERAWAEFYNDVRAGQAEAAVARCAGVDPEVRPFYVAQFKWVAELERLKAAGMRRFPDDVREDMGMLPPATVATARSTVDGDVATLSVVPPDFIGGGDEPEPTQITLRRAGAGGAWQPFAWDIAGSGVDDAEAAAEFGAPEFRQNVGKAVAAYENIARRTRLLAERVERGEVQDPNEIEQLVISTAFGDLGAE